MSMIPLKDVPTSTKDLWIREETTETPRDKRNSWWMIDKTNTLVVVVMVMVVVITTTVGVVTTRSPPMFIGHTVETRSKELQDGGGKLLWRRMLKNPRGMGMPLKMDNK